MPTDPYTWIEQSLATIQRANWYRSPQTLEGRPGPVVRIDRRELINFASNDYLGLAGDDRLIQAAVDATQEFGTGSTGARLLSGHRPPHRQLELAISALKQTEDALVFSSGYLANLGAIAALAGKRDLILSDQYNHSSLKNGAQLSGAAIVEYRHCDILDLKTQLQQHRQHHRRCLILTDTVFSMDGDICQLPALLDLAEEFSCMLLVDEAHATGVFGATGAGCVEHFGCTGRSLIQMGTLSKALGSLGGYVAGKAPVIDFLRNRAPSWVYTTGLSPADTAAALAAVGIVKIEPQRRAKLWQNVADLKQQLLDSGIIPISQESPIVCLPVPDAGAVLAVAQQLKASGIFAAAVRPPTVPVSRIRITVMATHEPAHIQQLVGALRHLNWVRTCAKPLSVGWVSASVTHHTPH
ncbi:8-amino-7-oxononanoate synthase [Kamptonema formosum]|uniref:8-amino-7-oxononanoate synthase n=1 Tax=Kamptonema formosum TaxID=331992 RepID=UPI00034CA12A|nr:8-amino-7-oxononanoate synthase [Oscillatoria sp. PCC 10802]